MDKSGDYKKLEKGKQYFWNFFSSLVFIGIIIFISFYFYSANKNIELSVFRFFILGLAIFRFTWLIVYDLVMNFARDFFKKFKSGMGYTISQLLGCPWCVGMWMSLIVLTLYVINPVTWFFILVAALAGLGTALDILIRFIWKRIQ
jgi:hypothetical protein